jgi:hypothetical protein
MFLLFSDHATSIKANIFYAGKYPAMKIFKT